MEENIVINKKELKSIIQEMVSRTVYPEYIENVTERWMDKIIDASNK